MALTVSGVVLLLLKDAFVAEGKERAWLGPGEWVCAFAKDFPHSIPNNLLQQGSTAYLHCQMHMYERQKRAGD